MAKYTDEQIKKGLWRCSYQEKVCPHCHFQENGKNCKEILMKNALDLINRQEAEIERLQHKIAEYPNRVLCSKGLLLTKSLAEYDELINDIASEAIKEFAEKVITEARLRLVVAYALTEESKAYTKGVIDARQRLIDVIERLLTKTEGEGE